MTGNSYDMLLDRLKELGGGVLAFSGGVDSALLLHEAQRVMGNRLVAVTVSTPYVPEREVREAKALARAVGAEHLVLELDFPESMRSNPADHCYHCKKRMFQRLREQAAEQGLEHVLDGTNVDDLRDYRPGLKAVQELGVVSPLLDAGLAKAEIRALSRQRGLSTWDKPSSGCLLSRMPAHVRVTDAALRRVERAEAFVVQCGFPVVRVRNHGDVARIEVPRNRLADLLDADVDQHISNTLKKLGFRHVTLDLRGYSMGSLNPKAN